MRDSKSLDLKDKYKEIANECKSAILNYDMMQETKILSAKNLVLFIDMSTVNRVVKRELRIGVMIIIMFFLFLIKIKPTLYLTH